MSTIATTSDVDSRIRTEFVEANKLRFEVDMCGDGDKLAICLHGFPEHSVSWRNQLPVLADLGYKAWAPNMRGYGNTTAPPFMEDYSLENLMDDVAALIDASQCKEVVLLAHDWGAIIAWYFAMRQLRPIDKLVICNVPHPVPAQRTFRKGFAQLRKSWYLFFFQLPKLPEMMMSVRKDRGMGNLIKDTLCNPDSLPPEVVDLYNQNGARPENLTAMVNYYRAMLRGGGGKRQEALGYPRIETPTLMLWGEDDMALTKATTYGTEEFVTNLTIRYLPRISHWVQQDAPVICNAMIAAFLTGEEVPEMKWEMKLASEDAG